MIYDTRLLKFVSKLNVNQ